MISSRRFWKHCMLLDDSPNACWIWVGAVRDDGRGRFCPKRGVEILAHHAAYELRFGEPPPKGRRLVKDCGNPQCVRHWILGGPYKKLGPAEISQIRSHDTAMGTITKLAHRLGVSVRHVFRVRSRSRT